MAVELDAFRAVINRNGLIELERNGCVRTRQLWRSGIAKFLGFPVGKQRRAAVVALVGLIERDYPQDAPRLLAVGDVSITDLSLNSGQLQRIFATVDRWAVEKPNPEHFIETSEVLSELVGRVVNNTIDSNWVLHAAARLEALGVGVMNEEYLTVAVEAAVEDQVAGRLMTREAITAALYDSQTLISLSASTQQKVDLYVRMARSVRAAHQLHRP